MTGAEAASGLIMARHARCFGTGARAHSGPCRRVESRTTHYCALPVSSMIGRMKTEVTLLRARLLTAISFALRHGDSEAQRRGYRSVDRPRAPGFAGRPCGRRCFRPMLVDGRRGDIALSGLRIYAALDAYTHCRCRHGWHHDRRSSGRRKTFFTPPQADPRKAMQLPIICRDVAEDTPAPGGDICRLRSVAWQRKTLQIPLHDFAPISAPQLHRSCHRADIPSYASGGRAGSRALPLRLRLAASGIFRHLSAASGAELREREPRPPDRTCLWSTGRASCEMACGAGSRACPAGRGRERDPRARGDVHRLMSTWPFSPGQWRGARAWPRDLPRRDFPSASSSTRRRYDDDRTWSFLAHGPRSRSRMACRQAGRDGRYPGRGGPSCGLAAGSPTNPVASGGPFYDRARDTDRRCAQREHRAWIDGGIGQGGTKGDGHVDRRHRWRFQCPPCMRCPTAHAPPRLEPVLRGGGEIVTARGLSSMADTVPLIAFQARGTAQGIDFLLHSALCPRSCPDRRMTSFAPQPPERADMRAWLERGNRRSGAHCDHESWFAKRAGALFPWRSAIGHLRIPRHLPYPGLARKSGAPIDGICVSAHPDACGSCRGSASARGESAYTTRQCRQPLHGPGLPAGSRGCAGTGRGGRPCSRPCFATRRPIGSSAFCRDRPAAMIVFR